MAIVRVRESFSAFGDPTGRISYAAGELVDSGSWVAKRHPHLFEAVEAHVSARDGVEEATAAPNKRRSVTRARKTTPPVEEAPTEEPTDEAPAED